MENDNEHKSNPCHEPICLLEKHLARASACIEIKETKKIDVG